VKIEDEAPQKRSLGHDSGSRTDETAAVVAVLGVVEGGKRFEKHEGVRMVGPAATQINIPTFQQRFDQVRQKWL